MRRGLKILLAYEYGTQYLESFYRRNPACPALAYQEQLGCLLADYYGWPAATVVEARSLGNETEIVIIDCEPLQRAWASENGTTFNEANWRYSVVRAQIATFRPDVLWIGAGPSYFGGFLRDLGANCRKILVWIASPQPPDTDLSGIDCVLTSHNVFIDMYRSRGKRCEKLLPAFAPAVLKHLTGSTRNVPLSFVGGLAPMHGGRLAALRNLAATTPLQLWGTCMKPPPVTGIRSLGRRVWHEAFVNSRRFRTRYRGEAWGLDVYRVLARSQVTFNSHIEMAARQAGNMRLFEATGCGAALLTEGFTNLSTMFAPNTEVVPYDGMTDLIEKAKYLVERPYEAEAIGAAGRKRTLAQHSSSVRAAELLDICNNLLR